MRDKKSSIVLVINSIQGGGAQRSVMTLGQGFFKLGFDVHIITLSDAVDYELNPNLNYHTITYKKFKYFPTRALRYKLLAKSVEDYISANIPNCILTLSNLVSSDRMLHYFDLTPCAHVIRNTFSEEYKSALKRKPKKTIRSYQAIYENHDCICISQGVEEDFKNIFGSNVTTKTIYNAFDKDAINIMSEEFMPEYDNYVVHVGKFKYAKAHEILLRAYAKSSQQFPLLLLGKGSLEPEMKKLSAKLGIDHKVHFMGFNKNPFPYIKHAKALILSSRFEGFARVILEAIALETPVISTDCPSGPNEFLPKNNLVPVEDVEALAEKMTQVMSDPDRFNVVFDEKFLPENIAMQYLKYFDIPLPN